MIPVLKVYNATFSQEIVLPLGENVFTLTWLMSQYKPHFPLSANGKTEAEGQDEGDGRRGSLLKGSLQYAPGDLWDV